MEIGDAEVNFIFVVLAMFGVTLMLAHKHIGWFRKIGIVHWQKNRNCPLADLRLLFRPMD